MILSFDITPIVLARFLMTLIGVIVAYYSLRLFDRSQPSGWRFLHYSAVYLYVWPFASLLVYLAEPSQAYIVDTIGFNLFAFFLSISIIEIVTNTLPIDTPKYFNLENVLALYAIVIGLFYAGGVLSYSIGPGFFTLIYLSNLFVLIPALFGLNSIYESVKTRIWAIFNISILFFVAAIVLNIYAATVCSSPSSFSICTNIMTGIAGLPSLPIFKPLLNVAIYGPILELFGLAIYGLGIVMIYRTLLSETKIRTENSDQEALILESINTFGPLIGTDLAHHIVEMGFEDHDISINIGDEGITFEDEPPSTTKIKSVLTESFESIIGPVANRKVEEVYKNIE